MFIEPLEPRIAPAIVNLLLAGKTLMVKADPFPEDPTEITITGLPNGGITVTPDAGTSLSFNGTVASAPVTIEDFGGALNVSLLGGSDTLNLSGQFTGSVAVDLGAGSNALNFQSILVSGNFTYKGGAEDDTVLFVGDDHYFLGNFTANLGNGVNLLQPQGVTTGLYIGKNFIANGGTGENTDNSFNTNAIRTHIGGNVTMKGGGMSCQFSVSGQETYVGGSVSFTSTPLVTGQVVHSVSGFFDLYVGGSVKMVTPSTNFVRQDIFSGGGDLYVGGSIALQSAKVNALNPLIITAAEDLHVGKGISVTGSDVLQLTLEAGGTAVIGGPLKVKGLRGAIIHLDGAIAGPTSVALGATSNGVVSFTPVDGSLRFAGPVQVSTALATNANITVGGTYFDSSLTIKDGGAAANISIAGSTVRGALTVDGGAGADLITMQGAAGQTALFAAVKILGGAGADVITVGGIDMLAKVTAFRPFLVDGGADSALLSTGPGTSFAIPLVSKNVQ